MTKNFSPTFTVNVGSVSQTIVPFETENGTLCVFLPSYAQMRNITVNCNFGKKLFINDTLIADGTDCSDFKTGTPYSFRLGRNDETEIIFYISSSIATLDIRTESGTMEYLDSDKNHEEVVCITLYNTDGTVDCTDSYAHLKGRGNSTWNLDKKPYTLTLSTDKPLLGMNSCSTWILLANAADETNLNNKIVYDFAKKLDFEWSPDCRYADVYLNGEYNGLYLISEKAEIDESRLNLQDGDFLCKNELDSRFDFLNNPFITDSGRTVEVNFPDGFTESDATDAQRLINELEKVIFSGTDLSGNTFFDLDSWAYKYLVDEIFANIDSDIASSYFYFCDGTFKGGPIWDYDMVLGHNNRNRFPTALIAMQEAKSASLKSPYYNALYKNESFYSRMTELYATEALPLLEDIISDGISELYRQTESASRMNSIRWSQMFEELYSSSTFPRSAEYITEYLRKRTDFLSDIWINRAQYHTLQLQPTKGAAYTFLSVKHGDTVDMTEYFPECGEWTIDTTGETADFSKPITSDTCLTAVPVEKPAAAKESASTGNMKFALISVAVMFIFFTVVAAINIIHYNMRRKADD